jgi:hypothetical protein
MDERKLVRNDPFYGMTTAMPGDHFLSLSMVGVPEGRGNR